MSPHADKSELLKKKHDESMMSDSTMKEIRVGHGGTRRNERWSRGTSWHIAIITTKSQAQQGSAKLSQAPPHSLIPSSKSPSCWNQSFRIAKMPPDVPDKAEQKSESNSVKAQVET